MFKNIMEFVWLRVVRAKAYRGLPKLEKGSKWVTYRFHPEAFNKGASV